MAHLRKSVTVFSKTTVSAVLFSCLPEAMQLSADVVLWQLLLPVQQWCNNDRDPAAPEPQTAPEILHHGY